MINYMFFHMLNCVFNHVINHVNIFSRVAAVYLCLFLSPSCKWKRLDLTSAQWLQEDGNERALSLYLLNVHEAHIGAPCVQLNPAFSQHASLALHGNLIKTSLAFYSVNLIRRTSIITPNCWLLYCMSARARGNLTYTYTHRETQHMAPAVILTHK